MIMSAESGLAKLKGTLHRIAYTAGIDLAGVANLRLTASVPRFADMADMDALGRMLRAREAAVLFIDPLYFCLDGDNQANLSAQGAQLRAVNEVCVSEGVTLILCHHTQKAIVNTFEPLNPSAISGAGHGEFARQWVLMSRRSEYQHDGFHEMWMVIGGSEGHGGCWALDADAKRVAKVLAKFPEGETKNVLRDAAGLPGNRFTFGLSKLIEDGEAVPCDVFKSNRRTPFEGCRLNDE